MSYIKQAVKLVQEGDRYSGHGRFFADFIDDWSYRQTGLYRPSTALGKPQSKLANQLSHITRSAWEAAPGDDFLGNVIEECGGSGHLSFFRTPPAISSLMAKLIGGSSGLEDYADICMGTGSLTLAYIKQTFDKKGSVGVAKLNLSGEDLSANKVKVAMLQVLNLLDILGGKSPLYVHSMKLIQVNSLSREFGDVVYDFSGANNPRCQLTKQQTNLVQEALTASVPIEIISERLRIPLNLVKRLQVFELA